MDAKYCKAGHEWIPENIYTRPSGKRQCKICIRIYTEKNKVKALIRSKLWQKAHPKRIAEINKKHRNTDEFRKKHNIAQRAYLKKYIPKLQKDVLTHYGGGKMACVCCGEDTFLFLTIDHMNGRKQYEKKNRKYRGWILKMYLRKNNYPVGYQTLCFNCNSGRALNGGVCPHLSKKADFL